MKIINMQAFNGDPFTTECVPDEMTDEIAFKLGAMDYPSFYGDAYWIINREPFELVKFFNWRLYLGTPLKQTEDGYVVDWENFSLLGHLNTLMFTEFQHRLSYVRGQLSRKEVKITDDTIQIWWANSYNIAEFTKRCFEAVLSTTNYSISIDEPHRGCIPGCPELTLKTSDKDIIEFLTNGI